MKLRFCFSSDESLRKAFSWLTRIGAGPKFGSSPIGWYQQHQCAALDYLRHTRGCGDKELRCRGGIIQSQCPDKKTWINEISARDLFDRADSFARNGKF